MAIFVFGTLSCFAIASQQEARYSLAAPRVRKLFEKSAFALAMGSISEPCSALLTRM
jgi:hypothetical protein